MNSSPPDPISRLAIPPEKKSRATGNALTPIAIVLSVVLVLIAILKLRQPPAPPPVPAANPAVAAQSNPARSAPAPDIAPTADSPLLSVTGYIVPRERIELTAKFPATVKAIHVRKGDQVKRGDLLVEMVDTTYQARVLETQGHLALAQARLDHAKTNYQRELQLQRAQSGTAQDLDDTRFAVESAQAEVLIAQGQHAVAETHLSWCTLRSPIDGTILDRLADPDEVVIPQGYGGPDSPVTTLVAIADLSQLQVEVDVNELDVAKVSLHQPCVVSPAAYPGKSYPGHVAEIAPEANRQKGTLQIKVQIDNPDNFLVPDLYAKVDFK